MSYNDSSTAESEPFICSERLFMIIHYCSLQSAYHDIQYMAA